MSDYESTARGLWSSWYQQDYQPLIDSVQESIKNHIKIFKEKNPNHKVYGYSIYTCNGFPHFGPVLNTIEELEEKNMTLITSTVQMSGLTGMTIRALNQQ